MQNNNVKGRNSKAAIAFKSHPRPAKLAGMIAGDKLRSVLEIRILFMCSNQFAIICN